MEEPKEKCKNCGFEAVLSEWNHEEVQDEEGTHKWPFCPECDEAFH